MKRMRAYKTQLHLNNQERTMLKRCAGASRFVYNWALADRKATFEAEGKPNKFEQKRRFNALKLTAYPWLAEVPYTIVESAFDNLDVAYKNFFRRVKKGEEEVGFPKFKSRSRGIGGFTVRGNIHIDSNQIRIPVIGWLRLAECDYLPTSGVKILSANISERAGCWFVSVQVEENAPDVEPAIGPALGLDVGIKTLAVCSDGTTFDNPKSLTQNQKRLARLQRELSRRKKGSKNRGKTKLKIAKLYYRIASIRSNTLHVISSHVTAKVKPATVVIEDLNVAGMLQNRKLSRAVADASFGELHRQVEYKAEWSGVRVVVADRWYPSSKTCSSCGTVKATLLLSERTYVCEACGATIDRDLNAAINLAALAEGPEQARIACGVSRQEGATVKQEERGPGGTGRS